MEVVQGAAGAGALHMTIGLGHYLAVAAILFTLGIFGIFLNRKNVIVILMSIELILLAVNINFVAFSTFLGDIVGQVFALLVLTVAAAEAAIGLAILVVYLPQPRLDRGRRHQPDEGLSRLMYQAIVFLPLLGCIVAALISLSGARARHPGGSPGHGADDHAHDHGPHASGGAPSPHGDHASSITTATTSIRTSRRQRARARPSSSPRCSWSSPMLLSWIAFWRVGICA